MNECDFKETNGGILGKLEWSGISKSWEKFSKVKSEMCPLDLAIRRA